MTNLRVLLWNVAWGRTARAREAVRKACSRGLDVICLTETTDALLVPPPSEPDMRISRIRLSSQWGPQRD